jgi:N-acetylmuramoyl-L-alanine amidase
MRIWIDNGHGADTKGKQSPDGRLREYAYARDIARRVVDALKKKGLDAQLLVPEEEDISLQERCARANRVKDSILVSVHCNAAGSGTQWMAARGWEAWTSVGQTKADKLASGARQAQVKMVREAVKEYMGDIQVEAFSSLKKQGVDKLSQKLDTWFSELPPEVLEDALSGE